MNFFVEFKKIWDNLKISQKIGIFLMISLIVVGVSLISFYGNKTDYSLLFSGLGPDDAGLIIEKLKEERVDYEIKSGNAIFVPSERKYDLRISLASQGLPKGSGIGFEIFDKTNIGMTDFVQKLNYQRALQGELIRTISQINGVVKARVHLVLPEDTLFTEDKKATTASVVLLLKPSCVLAKSQIKGITHLMASSVEGLSIQYITILDSMGNILFKGTEENSIFTSSSNQLELQRNIEVYLSKKAQSMLDNVIGVGNSIIKVAAKLNFKQMEKTQEKYDPEAVVKSETVMEESASGSSSKPQGTTGTDSNLEEDKNANTSTSNNQNNKTTTTTSYEIGRTVEKVINEIGDIQRLTIAVFVKQRIIKNEEGEEIKIPGDSEVLEYTGIVKQAVGFDVARGDKIELKAVPYKTYDIMTSPDRDEGETLVKSENRNVLITQVAKYGITIALLFFLFIILKNASGNFTKIGDVGSVNDMSGSVNTVVGDTGYSAFDSIHPESLDGLNPEDIANVIKSWLSE